jgi:hypothetical protein
MRYQNSARDWHLDHLLRLLNEKAGVAAETIVSSQAVTAATSSEAHKAVRPKERPAK